jgi:cathepsin L
MRLRSWAFATGCIAIIGIATLPPTASAGPIVMPTPIIPPVLPSFYTQRELTAPAAIKAQLAHLRQLQTGASTYSIGYTTAMDTPLSTLAGLVVPADAQQQVTAAIPTQAALLKADETAKEQYKRSHPNWTPTVAPFTASSLRGDWRTAGMVPPIRDQGYCGSCWAFAVMGAYESSLLIRSGTSLDTSEQSLLSCSWAGSCKGGWPGAALAWLTETGAQKEAELPYTSYNGAVAACASPYVPDVKSVAFGYIQQDYNAPSIADLKAAIVQYGPVIVTLYASPSFQAYAGGSFYENDSGVRDANNDPAVNHVVVIVGWDDTVASGAPAPTVPGAFGSSITTGLPPLGAWIMRNSWGTGWGETADYGTERGYMYLGYGSSNLGLWAQWVQAPAPYTPVSGTIPAIMHTYRQATNGTAP